MTTAEGKHNPTQFLQVLWAIRSCKQSGTLEIESGSFQRTLYFLDGHTVLYQSNLPDDGLEHSLKRHVLLPDAQLNWLLSKMTSSDSLEEELLKSGIFSAEQLQEHKIDTMQEGIGQCLSWETGVWRFVAHPWLSEAVDPRLQIRIDILSALWKGVRRLSDNQVYGLLSALMSHPFQGERSTIQQTLQTLALDEWTWVEDALAEGNTLTTIAQQGANTQAVDSFRLIWVMFHLGLLNAEEPQALFEKIINAPSLERDIESIQKRKAEEERSQRKKRIQERKERQALAEQREIDALSIEIREEHQKRIGRHFYEFLGMPISSSYKQLELQVRKLNAKWKEWLKKSSSDKDKERVRELLMGSQVIYAVLVNPERRPEYDRALKEGRAAIVNNPKAMYIEERKRKHSAEPNTQSTSSEKKTSPPPATEDSSVDQIRKDRILTLVHRKQFDKALPHLQKYRQDIPSDPDILAALGWSIWQLKQDTDSATEYLKLAITFDGKHKEALEWLAQILATQDEHEQTSRILKHLLKLDPKHEWATETLRQLQTSTEDRTNKSWFNRK